MFISEHPPTTEIIEMDNHSTTKSGYCIYINTFFQGPVPVVRDETDNFVVYATELEAQREIAEYTIDRIHQFLQGEREFGDAIIVEEYVVPVTVFADGSITDEDGNVFSKDSF